MTDNDELAATAGFERQTRAAARRYDQAVIEAEVRRLARALRSSPVMRRDARERSAAAAYRNDGGFERDAE